MKLFEMVVE